MQLFNFNLQSFFNAMGKLLTKKGMIKTRGSAGTWFQIPGKWI